MQRCAVHCVSTRHLHVLEHDARIRRGAEPQQGGGGSRDGHGAARRNGLPFQVLKGKRDYLRGRAGAGVQPRRATDPLRRGGPSRRPGRARQSTPHGWRRARPSPDHSTSVDRAEAACPPFRGTHHNNSAPCLPGSLVGCCLGAQGLTTLPSGGSEAGRPSPPGTVPPLDPCTAGSRTSAGRNGLLKSCSGSYVHVRQQVGQTPQLEGLPKKRSAASLASVQRDWAGPCLLRRHRACRCPSRHCARCAYSIGLLAMGSSTPRLSHSSLFAECRTASKRLQDPAPSLPASSTACRHWTVPHALHGWPACLAQQPK